MSESVTVTTTSGALRGVRSGKVATFLGVPYARAPVGEHRWRSPQPCEPWGGVRDAIAFGPICPQPALSPELIVSPERSTAASSEDCLFLNIWTSPLIDTKAATRPVMVWIHGGGFFTGSGSEIWYDGTRFAERGVTFVTVNYRLGPLGFLAHPDLLNDGCLGTTNNYGLLDQVFALQWIKANISRFGGDPNNVTIIGESAGAAGVRCLMEMPVARGLFHRAILQSGGFGSSAAAEQAPTLQAKLRVGSAYQKALGARSIADMRELPVDTLISAMSFRFREKERGLRWWPTPNGFLPRSDSDAVSVRTADVPILMGTNANEGVFFAHAFGAGQLTYLGMSLGIFGSKALHLFRQNSPLSRTGSVDGVRGILANYFFVERCYEMATRLRALGRRCHIYHFQRIAPKNRSSDRLANHTYEIPYVFGAIRDESGYEDTDFKLSEAMQTYWINFARAGDPNDAHLPDWPAFCAENPAVMRFGDEPTIGDYPSSTEFRLLRDLRK